MTDKVPCRYFLNGCCKNGDTCRFAHDWSLEANMICRYYQAGNCIYGDKCRYDHIRPQEQPQCQSYTPPSIPKPQPAQQSQSQSQQFLLQQQQQQQQQQQVNIVNGSNSIKGGKMAWKPNVNAQVYKGEWEEDEEGEWEGDDFYEEGEKYFNEQEEFEPYDFYEEGEEYQNEQEGFDPWKQSAEQTIVGNSLPPDPADLPLCTEYQVMGQCKRDEDCPYIHGDFCDICEKYAIHPYNEEQQKLHTEEKKFERKKIKKRQKKKKQQKKAQGKFLKNNKKNKKGE
eukprot:TRINITY_DN21935_c0_g1_i3.p1 TRINITY_DN21935_c0_g1~~TRINITY_DN21935_c0_g1_i3.p1  ORF type:complete len:283 (+),score=61.81 TRINITY_DN21935_c0_g1_i3:109-957(+)